MDRHPIQGAAVTLLVASRHRSWVKHCMWPVSNEEIRMYQVNTRWCTLDWKRFYFSVLFSLYSDRVALLAGSVGVDSSSGSTSGTSFPRAKGLWQVTQKQKTVDDLVNEGRILLWNVLQCIPFPLTLICSKFHTGTLDAFVIFLA